MCGRSDYKPSMHAVAGHGGQGVLELANHIAYFHFAKGMHVAYTPSYGPESKGGKVKCYVVASEGEIDSTIVEEPDFLVVMNIPSMDFVPMLKKGGTPVMNMSLVTSPSSRRKRTLWCSVRTWPSPKVSWRASWGWSKKCSSTSSLTAKRSTST